MVEAFQGRARGEHAIDAQLRPRSCAPDPAGVATTGNDSRATASPCGVRGGCGAAAAGPPSSQPRERWPEGGLLGGEGDIESPLSAAAVSSEQPLSWGRPGGQCGCRVGGTAGATGHSQEKADDVPLLTRVLYDWMGWFGPSAAPVAPSSRSEKVAAWRRKSAALPAPPVRPPRDDITRDEVARHNRKDDAWVIVNGTVYCVTEYLGYHPGGASILARYAGKDASAAFMRQHPWVNVRATLARCRVGTLAVDAMQARARAEAAARVSAEGEAAAAAGMLSDAHGLSGSARPATAAAVAGAHHFMGLPSPSKPPAPALPAPATPQGSTAAPGCSDGGFNVRRPSEPECRMGASSQARARYSEAGLPDARRDTLRDTSVGGTRLLEGNPRNGGGSRESAADATQNAAGACHAGVGPRLQPSPRLARVA